MRLKPILTVLGRAKMLRAYYWCPRCRQGQFPADIARDIEDTEYSPGVRRMLALVGSECSSFDRGRQQMELLADLEVTAKAVERVTEVIGADIARRQQETIQRAIQLELPVAVGEPIQKIYVQMDGTGLPMVAKETEGRSGKGADGRAHTREAKLGCVFTQTTTDDQGRPVRDDGSTTYTGAIETAAEFSRRIYTEAHQRGWGRAQVKVVMGDGADWIWNICEEQFPGAIQIVDLYHARQHLWDLGGKLHPNDVKAKRRWVMAHQHFLDDGKIEKLVAKLRSLSPDNPELAAAVRIEANYFERNTERMRYPKFRKQDLFVGSGVIEAGCKTGWAPASSARACSGPFEELTPSLPSVAVATVASLTTIGSTVAADYLPTTCRAPAPVFCGLLSRPSFPVWMASIGHLILRTSPRPAP